MAETLTELVAKISTDAAGLKSGLSDAEKQTEASSKKMQDSLKKVGMAMAASGAAITAALGLMGKAALDEEINMKRLATTINNSGTAYDSVKDSMEALISATQRKTGVADNEQRDILNRLILVTNDYGKAMELLPTVLDLAAAGEMDATTAATYLGKAYLDLQDGAEEVSVRFGQASLQFKNMEDIQNRVAGSAENLANPLSILKASIGDVAEALGANLIPLIKDATSKIVDITIKIQEWVKEHPVLAKVLTLVALGVGAVLTVVGGLILAMPIITSMVAAFGVVLNAAIWPISLIALGIAGLVAGGVLLWKNWDKVSKEFTKIFLGMKKIALSVIDKLLDSLQGFIRFIPFWGDKIDEFRQKISRMVDSEKIRGDIENTKKNLEGLTKTVKDEFDKQSKAIQSAYNAQRTEAQKTYNAAVEAINKEYGIGEAAKTVSKTKIDAAREATQRLKEQYAREKDAAKDRYDAELSAIREVFALKTKQLNKAADSTIQSLQDEMDALDKQTSQEELAITRVEEQSRLAELKGAMESAKTAEDKKDTQIAYAEYAAQIERNEILRNRDAQRDSLQAQIDDTRRAAQTQAEQLNESETIAEKALEANYGREAEINRLRDEAADQALKDNLARIEKDRLAAIGAEQAKLDKTLETIQSSEAAEIEFFTNQLERTNTQIKEINLAYDALKKQYDIDIITHGGMITPPSSMREYSSGGTVPGAIGQPQLAMVHGGETIIPANQSGVGNIVVNVQGSVITERELGRIVRDQIVALGFRNATSGI